MSATIWILLLAVSALIPAYLAARKQPSRRWGTFATYYLFGLLFLVAAIPVAIWVAKDERKSDAACSEQAISRVQDHLSRGS